MFVIYDVSRYDYTFFSSGDSLSYYRYGITLFLLLVTHLPSLSTPWRCVYQ